MISDEAVEAAAKGFAPHWDADGGWFAAQEFMPKLRAALEAAAPHMLAPVVADLDNWAGRSKTGYYDEAQDDVVQILASYRPGGPIV